VLHKEREEHNHVLRPMGDLTGLWDLITLVITEEVVSKS
jgi:hypothetical protein